MKHTEGPWVVDSELELNGTYVFGASATTGEPYCVCEMRICSTTEADARLIAAAPSMLIVIEKYAQQGDTDCIKLLEAINGSS